MADKKELPNVKALKGFRLKGKHVEAGTVLAKEDFPKKSDWQNLCSMNPSPRCEETDEAVGKAKVAAKKADEASAKKAGGVPAA